MDQYLILFFDRYSTLMHADGNIKYATYQSEIQMKEYLVSQGHTEIISDIV